MCGPHLSVRRYPSERSLEIVAIIAIYCAASLRSRVSIFGVFTRLGQDRLGFWFCLQDSIYFRARASTSSGKGETEKQALWGAGVLTTGLTPGP